MKNKYTAGLFIFMLGLFLMSAIVSCKKNSPATPAVTTASPVKLALYEEQDSSIYKLLFMEVSKIGTQTINDDLIFDTGSGGMVIDANADATNGIAALIPASMISSSGFVFTGDSVVVNGITITNQESVVEYGGDNASLTKVYGNLAYAPVTIGDANGNLVISRLPFFLYYKGVDAKGNKLPAHYFDVLGVNTEYDVPFTNGAYITSPFSYYVPGTGLTAGFKMAALGTSNFSNGNAKYVQGVVTVGLTAADISSTSGFVTSTLTFYNGAGYLPILPTTITYGTKTTSTQALFDTGTEPDSYIEDKTASSTLTQLPANTAVSLATTSGFSYKYTTSATENLTYIENPTTSGAEFSILSLEFFLNNEYMINFSAHTLGLKNN